MTTLKETKGQRKHCNRKKKPQTIYSITKLFLLALIVFCKNSLCQNNRHVIIISIDGLRPDFYLDRSWPAPNLQQLMKEGVYAQHMKSVFPSFTYPSHVAMLTGALPARSGIHYNAKPGSQQWNWFTSAIKVPTLWQALKQNGMTTSAVQWPVSVDSNITWNMPEIWDPKHPEDRITETRKYATPGLIEEIEVNATGKLTTENMSEEYFSLDENASCSAAYIFNTYKPNLLCVHFALVDGMEHAYGREHDSVRLAVAVVDRAVGHILESIERSGMGDSTTVMIVGDHGFSDIKQVLRPNVWIKDIDARFQPAGGACFLYGREKEEQKEKQKEKEKIIKLVIKKFESIPKAHRKLFRIINRKALDKMGADSSALLALAAVPGIVFSGSLEGEQLTPVKGGHHGYDPSMKEMYTGFIAAGAGINKSSMIKELCVTDIAPLIAELLGIEFKTSDGRLPKGIVR